MVMSRYSLCPKFKFHLVLSSKNHHINDSYFNIRGKNLMQKYHDEIL